MTETGVSATPIGSRVFDHQVEVAESWSIDVRDTVPSLPEVAMRASYSSAYATGPVLDILVRRTTVGRRTRISVTLLGDDQEDARDRPSVEFSSGSSRRVTGLPAAFLQIIAEQTGVSW